MKKIIFGIFIVLGLLLNFSTEREVFAAQQPNNMDAKQYLMDLHKDFYAENLTAHILINAETPMGNLNLDMNVIGKSSEPIVYKVTNKMTFQMLGQTANEVQVMQYAQQKGNDLEVYTLDNKKWYKQKFKNFKGTSSEKELMEMQLALIKSVSIQYETEDSLDAEYIFDFSPIGEFIESSLSEDKDVFKNEADKKQFISVCKTVMNQIGEMSYKEHLDKKNKSITTTLDFSDTVRRSADAIMDQFPEMKLRDRVAVKQFLDASTITMNTEIKPMDGNEEIKVPEEAIKNAEEMKLDKSGKVKK